MPLTDHEAREHVARIETMLERIESLPDRPAREAALGAVQGLLDLYGEGLARVVGHIERSCEAGDAERIAQACADDEVVSHLLMLHGLHPEGLQLRVERALDSVRPYLRSHGGGVELLGIEHGVARLSFAGTCHGCPSSSVTFRTTVEEAIRAAAPELRSIESVTDGSAPPAPSVPEPTALVPLQSRGRRTRTPESGVVTQTSSGAA